MGGSSKKGGDIPHVDPEQLLERSAELNRTGTRSPFVTSHWEEAPDGTWTQVTGYTDEVQPIFDRALGFLDQDAQQVDMGMNLPAGLDSAFGAAMTRVGDRMGTDIRPQKPPGEFAAPAPPEAAPPPEERPPPPPGQGPSGGGGGRAPTENPPWERPGLPDRRPF